MWILVALLVTITPLRSLAGDSYLDRSKIREAVPYGTTIEQRPSDGKATRPSMPERESGQPGSIPPGSATHEPIRDDSGRSPDRR